MGAEIQHPNRSESLEVLAGVASIGRESTEMGV